ncbi:MAG: hypothetical protein HBSAPP01_15560 [Candidatus Brocadia sapporoensis]|nr:MAG: hypothetical protein HBSAPP01_15560 [Candidatus Brocadia sapporoensis]
MKPAPGAFNTWALLEIFKKLNGYKYRLLTSAQKAERLFTPVYKVARLVTK